MVCDCVGASHAFWVSDLLFGVMLGWLSLCSLAWHATNSPTSQYFDLWAMDSSIAYLIVRFLLLAAYQAMVSFGVSTDLATAVAAWGCAVIYALSISANGLHYVSSYRGNKRWLVPCCFIFNLKFNVTYIYQRWYAGSGGA